MRNGAGMINYSLSCLLVCLKIFIVWFITCQEPFYVAESVINRIGNVPAHLYSSGGDKQ